MVFTVIVLSMKSFTYYRVIQSFETVVFLFAQQLDLNQTQNITLDSLTVIAELVSCQ